MNRPYIFLPDKSIAQKTKGDIGTALQTLQVKNNSLFFKDHNDLIAMVKPNKSLTNKLHVRFCSLPKPLHFKNKNPLKINPVRFLLENVRKFSNTYPQVNPLKTKEMPCSPKTS